MNIPFIKMHGLGNDFIIFDNIKNSIISDKNFIRQIGNRRLGIGCDQLMMIENTSKKDNFKIAGQLLKSRLIVGTGKYKNKGF